VSRNNSSMIREWVSLKSHNSFHIDANAAFWTEVTSENDLLRLMDTAIYLNQPRFILGGGSNILFTQDFPGLIMKIRIPGITVVSENEHEVILKIGAGVIWDDLVCHAIDRGWGGLENLSMIPGETGAAPIQNIGAYGVELESVFVSLDAVDLKTGELSRFDRDMCRFGYRDSIFKRDLKGRVLITSVTLKLSKQHRLHVEYGNLREVLSADGITEPDIRQVGLAVRKIRSSKLPDPAVTGNAGSFFKNPVIPQDQFLKLRETHPQIPSYPAGSQIKIPAAWLIDQCGFKGKRLGDAGVHERHALILVNHGKATGKDILDLAETIRAEVQDRFGITLEPEVNLV